MNLIKKATQLLSYLLRTTLICLITGIRPLLGPSNCRYAVGCTPFAIEQLRKHTSSKAIWLIIKRVLSCNPFSRYQEIEF